MKLLFNITVYHGTDRTNVDSIAKYGFNLDTISCATQCKYFAKGYGNTLIAFKYPFVLYFSISTLKEDFEYLKRFIRDYFDKSLMVGVAGYKPNIRLVI